MLIRASTLLAATVVSVCACTTVIPLETTVVSRPGGVPVPLAVGVHYSTEFRTYEYSRQKLVVPLGQASVVLLEQALPMIFERVVRVSSPTPRAADGTAELAAVIEPKIEEASFDRPPIVVSMADVTAEVIYRFTLYSPAGDPVASWKVRGFGRPAPGWFTWKTEPFSKAMDLAMRDAAQKLMTGFREIPEVRRWLRDAGIPEAL